MELKKGDCIVVRADVSDPDFGTRLEGWRGRILEVDGDFVDVSWDSATLQQMGIDLIIRCENENLDWKSMRLHVGDVQSTEGRDTPADVERVARVLWDRALDDPRMQGEQAH